MWKRPDNIPQSDWVMLTRAWDSRKTEVYQRFRDVAKEAITTDEIDGILDGLLSIYCDVETHAQQGADWSTQLKDEFRKSYWVDAKIQEWLRDYPELRKETDVDFTGESKKAILANKCMGGIVRAFIEITREVYSDRFGRPYEGNPNALRNFVLERQSWKRNVERYRGLWSDYLTTRERDPAASPPQIARQ